MKYRLLGNSGLRCSELALGTMTFGEDWGWGAPKEEAQKVYDGFRDAGGNFIDTANVYTNGASEAFVGEFAKGHRQNMVLATKYSNAIPGNDPNAAGNQRKSMVQAVEASLKRLQTDYIDLFIDDIAERVVELGGVALGTVQVVAKNSRLPAYSLTVFSGKEHVTEFSGALAKFGATNRAAIDTAGKAGDADTADLFTEVSRGVDKLLWFVEAHLQAKE